MDLNDVYSIYEGKKGKLVYVMALAEYNEFEDILVIYHDINEDKEVHAMLVDEFTRNYTKI